MQSFAHCSKLAITSIQNSKYYRLRCQWTNRNQNEFLSPQNYFFDLSKFKIVSSIFIIITKCYYTVISQFKHATFEMAFDMGNNIEICESLKPRDKSVFWFKIYIEPNTVLRFERFCSQTIIISLFHQISYIGIWLQAAKQCKNRKIY